ncbi:hypothetical protein AwDysgo_13870 [Bacteroidales bacterium]|nr:hypothetical protein AwDysgo_13870 [Bacteroidales bacterium]
MLKKKKDIKLFGNMKLMRPLMPDISLKRQYLKFWILFACTGLFVVMIARPQFGEKLETSKKKGVEVMVCLDVSNSMLSDDIKPNRLEKSKQILSKLVDNLKDDKIGLIVFAGDAYIQLPITSDYVSAKMFLSSINTNMVPNQGTSIGSAINLALRSFSPNEASDKTIIILTDGEGHEDDAVGASRNAGSQNIKVNVLGLGTPQGSPIPLDGKSNNFLKDREGNVVITKLNEGMCQEIAAASGGIYIRVDQTNAALRALQQEVDKLNKSELETKSYSSYDEKFQLFAWILLILLILEFFILDRKNRIFRKVKLFSVFLIFFLGFGSQAFAQKEVRKNIHKGNDEYKVEKYTESEITYRKALEINKQSLEAAYNLGNALYKQQKFPEAAEQYKEVVERETDKAKLSSAYHNMGNIFMEGKDYAQSITAYKQALRNNPRDDETRYNLALAQKLLEKQEQEDDGKGDKDDQNDDKDKKDEDKDKGDDKKDEQNDKNEQNKDDENKQQEQDQQNEQMSKDNAQQILDALLQNEKDTQEKVKEAQKQQQERRKIDKNW